MRHSWKFRSRETETYPFALVYEFLYRLINVIDTFIRLLILKSSRAVSTHYNFRWVRCVYQEWYLSRNVKKKNIPSDMCDQRRLKSACASAQLDKSLRCPHVETLHPWLHVSIMRTVRRLIWIFAGRACPKIRFLSLRFFSVQCAILTRNYIRFLHSVVFIGFLHTRLLLKGVFFFFKQKKERIWSP